MLHLSVSTVYAEYDQQVILFIQLTGRRACRYPGAPVRGVITPVKFVYSVGDQISVVCDQGFFVPGSKSVHCTEEGMWSDEVPHCEDFME